MAHKNDYFRRNETAEYLPTAATDLEFSSFPSECGYNMLFQQPPTIPPNQPPRIEGVLPANMASEFRDAMQNFHSTPLLFGSTVNVPSLGVAGNLEAGDGGHYGVQFSSSSTAIDISDRAPMASQENFLNVDIPFIGNAAPDFESLFPFPSTQCIENNFSGPAPIASPKISFGDVNQIRGNTAAYYAKQFPCSSTLWTENSISVPAPMETEISFNVANTFLSNTAAEARSEYTGLLSDVVNFASTPRRLGAEVNLPEREPAPRVPLPPHNEADIRNVRLNSQKKRRKLNSWSKDEHTLFLIGLDKYGAGHWKQISTNIVVTKTAAQVASHAQKFFHRRLKSSEHKLKFPSIHDITTVDPDSKARLLTDRRPRLPSPPSATCEPSSSGGTYIDFTAVSHFDYHHHSS